jgi:non-specific serine/threonine protein kinase
VAALRREGDVWRVEYEGRTRFVKDAKGLRHLALLLDNPGVEFHAVDIVGQTEGTTAAPGARGSAAGDSDVEARRAGDGDAGALLDPQAKREYRSRLEDLRAEIEEAESFNDPERAARAREELEFIGRELSSAVGLGGRDRKAASNAERARVNVTRAVKGVIRRIAAEDESLGRELETTVHTGYFCRYEPDPRHPVTWQVDGG